MMVTTHTPEINIDSNYYCNSNSTIYTIYERILASRPHCWEPLSIVSLVLKRSEDGRKNYNHVCEYYLNIIAYAVTCPSFY